MSDRPPETDFPAAGFDTYDDFVKAAIKDYYDRGWATRKGNFIALVIASGQVFSMARDQVTGEGGLKKMAIGAVGIVALRVGLRFVSGPLGILLTAASLASLGAFLAKNQKEISQKVPRFRELIAQTRTRFDEIQNGYRAGRYDARERNLMVDGLHKRFLAECDEG
jgi:hypothetical protein